MTKSLWDPSKLNLILLKCKHDNFKTFKGSGWWPQTEAGHRNMNQPEVRARRDVLGHWTVVLVLYLALRLWPAWISESYNYSIQRLNHKIIRLFFHLHLFLIHFQSSSSARPFTESSELLAVYQSSSSLGAWEKVTQVTSELIRFLQVSLWKEVNASSQASLPVCSLPWWSPKGWKFTGARALTPAGAPLWSTTPSDLGPTRQPFLTLITFKGQRNQLQKNYFNSENAFGLLSFKDFFYIWAALVLWMSLSDKACFL